MFSFVAGFVERSLAFLERCDLAWVTVTDTVMASTVLLDQKDHARVQVEPMRLRSET